MARNAANTPASGKALTTSSTSKPLRLPVPSNGLFALSRAYDFRVR